MKLYDENKSISGFNLRKLLFVQDNHEYVRGLVETVFKLWEKKKIHPIIDSVFAFEDVADAMQKMHDRRNVGKIILDPAAEPKPKPIPDPEVEAKEKPPGRTTSLLRKLSTKTVRDNSAASGAASASTSGAEKKDEKEEEKKDEKKDEKKETNGSKDGDKK